MAQLSKLQMPGPVGKLSKRGISPFKNAITLKQLHLSTRIRDMQWGETDSSSKRKMVAKTGSGMHHLITRISKQSISSMSIEDLSVVITDGYRNLKKMASDPVNQGAATGPWGKIL